jgi:hypothetical protein
MLAARATLRAQHLLAAAVSAERALLVIGSTTCLQETAAEAAENPVSKLVNRQAISHQTLNKIGAVCSVQNWQHCN